jgi:hypothetical protein
VPYELTWYAADEVLRLELQDSLSPDRLKLVNQHVVDILNESGRRLALLIDVCHLKAGYATADHLRKTQLYRDHSNLETIIVVANSKLNRLITLLAFNLSRARFVQFDSMEKAQVYMTHRGFSEDTMMVYRNQEEAPSDNGG